MMLLVSVVLVVIIIILAGHIAHQNKEEVDNLRPLQGYRYSDRPTADAMELIKSHPYASAATQHLILVPIQIWQLQAELIQAELNAIILCGLGEVEIDESV